MNQLTESPWAEIVATAPERIKIGQDEVYLYRTAMEDLDWSCCMSMERGSLIRLGMDVSVRFTFWVEGLTIQWSFDLEKRGANGKSGYDVDAEGILRLLALLPAGPKREFLAYLGECADAIEGRAAESLTWVMDQYGQAATLRGLATDRAATASRSQGEPTKKRNPNPGSPTDD